jgi:probable O-glycosylation ligase (exosortase A-associated)
MKNILITLSFAFALPIALRFPIVGVMLYLWIDLAAPQSFGSSGFLSSIRWGLIAILVTLLGMAFSQKDAKLKTSKMQYFLILYWFVWAISTAFVIGDAEAVDKFFRFTKAMLISLIIIQLVDTRERFEYLAWTIFLAVGIHSILGAIKTIASGGGGAYVVVGPDGTHIADRNYFALAMLIGASIGAYLAHYSELVSNKKIVKPLVFGIILTSLIAVIGTHSRGGFLGLVACLLAISFFFKGRLKLIPAIIILAFAIVFFAPDEWANRMLTLTKETESLDGSALGRLRRWQDAFQVALQNPWFGGGPMVLLKIQDAQSGYALVAHSMYAESLSELGFLGCGLFLAILLAGSRMAFAVARQKQLATEYDWMRAAAKGAFCANVCVLVSGAFLDMSAHVFTYLPTLFSLCLYRLSNSVLVESQKKIKISRAFGYGQ